jgi:hypothetical protein
MSAFPFPVIEAPTFKATLAVEDSAWRMRWAGTADLLVQKQLGAFLTEAHECAASHMASRVVVDLTELKFINSSCLKNVVSWLIAVKNDSKDRQYHIVFRINPKAGWQDRSFTAMSCMCSDLVTLES